MKWDWSEVHAIFGLICGCSLWWGSLFAFFIWIPSLIFEIVMSARQVEPSHKLKDFGRFLGGVLIGWLLLLIPWVREAMLWTPK